VPGVEHFLPLADQTFLLPGEGKSALSAREVSPMGTEGFFATCEDRLMPLVSRA
jgi:hypothetical protein